MPNVNCHDILTKPYAIPPQKNGEVFLTARSLFLNESLACHKLNTPSLSWNYGSYSSCLRLTTQVLNSWRNKSILDIGGGASIFPEEAQSLLGARVVAIDLNKKTVFSNLNEAIDIQDARLIQYGLLPEEVLKNGSVQKYEKLIRYLYKRNLEWLYCKHGGSAQGLKNEFEYLVEHRDDIAASFYLDDTQHQEGDATRSTHFQRNTFDVVISVWVLNYLDNEQKKRVLKNAFYWTKPTAQVRINPGTENAQGSQQGTLDEASFKRLFQGHVIEETTYSIFGSADWYVNYEGKKITVNRESGNGLLVLDTVPAA